MTTFDTDTVTRTGKRAPQEQARGNGPQSFVDLPVEERSSDRQDDRPANRLAASEELRGLDTLFAPASLSDSLSQRLNELVRDTERPLTKLIRESRTVGSTVLDALAEAEQPVLTRGEKNALQLEAERAIIQSVQFRRYADDQRGALVERGVKGWVIDTLKAAGFQATKDTRSCAREVVDLFTDAEHAWREGDASQVALLHRNVLHRLQQSDAMVVSSKNTAALLLAVSELERQAADSPGVSVSKVREIFRADPSSEHRDRSLVLHPLISAAREVNATPELRSDSPFQESVRAQLIRGLHTVDASEFSELLAKVQAGFHEVFQRDPELTMFFTHKDVEQEPEVGPEPVVRGVVEHEASAPEAGLLLPESIERPGVFEIEKPRSRFRRLFDRGVSAVKRLFRSSDEKREELLREALVTELKGNLEAAGVSYGGVQHAVSALEEFLPTRRSVPGNREEEIVARARELGEQVHSLPGIQSRMAEPHRVEQPAAGDEWGIPLAHDGNYDIWNPVAFFEAVARIPFGESLNEAPRLSSSDGLVVTDTPSRPAFRSGFSEPVLRQGGVEETLTRIRTLFERVLDPKLAEEFSGRATALAASIGREGFDTALLRGLAKQKISEGAVRPETAAYDFLQTLAGVTNYGPEVLDRRYFDPAHELQAIHHSVRTSSK